MASNAAAAKQTNVGDQIIAIRERWHTKNHPYFKEFAEGKVPLKSLGNYLALHYQFVQRALASFGNFYARAFQFEDLRKTIVENLAEEEGLQAIPQPGHVPHDHNELIFRFCRAAGLGEAEVRGMKMSPAWWARSLHYTTVMLNEPIGVALAMQTTQEGQQPALNSEYIIPALVRHHGFKAGAPEIEFYTEHAAADVEHSGRQLTQCLKHLGTPELEARALQVAQEAVELRWASVTELYRSDVLRTKEVLPPSVA
jgi:pyrroloquinoline quinone (PQQ) biosynthesis protein C